MTAFGAEDRLLLRDTVARFAAAEYSRETRRDILGLPEAYSPGIWKRMAELGLVGLGVAAERGGSGGGSQELGLVMEMVGRHLMMEPFLQTAVICAPLAVQLDTGGQVLDLESILAGDRIVALAHSEPKLGFARWPIETRAEHSADGVKLYGAKSFVLSGPVAHDLLVTAQEVDGRVGVYQAPAGAEGLEMRRFKAVDGRLVANLELNGVRAQRLGADDAREALALAWDRAAVALGFEAVGSMNKLVEDTGEHIRTRRAFGGVLSQFQVLQHRLVDMFVLAKEAAASVAAAAAAEGTPEGERLAAAAKVHVSRAGRFVAENAVQLHGGLGVSDETIVSHQFKRLMMVEALHGDAEHHLERFIDLKPSQAAL